MTHPQGPDAPAPRSWPAPPPLTALPTETPGAPPTAPKKSGPARQSLRILGVVAIAVVSWASVSAWASRERGARMTPVRSPHHAPTTARTPTRATTHPPRQPPLPPLRPQPADFTVNVVTIEKSCFGSAGGNITYTVELSNLGPSLDPSDTWQVIYDIAGGEQPKADTIEVTGSNYS